ncbi:MAG TPA: glutamine-hydrolyzing carbamoyl-phosphate synthase small subunit [Bacteroidia bacterium]|jgi:carbamoyl-phosphate synthase small subunit|nr:glutamine-hydrolyzing carbamoyl-phosphate synthase small subunit [Bacteroidia bacterium]
MKATYINKKPALLVLQDGKVFTGKAAGKIGTTTGEICFNTGMTGYQEIFTDPSYFGQILVTTNVHIGNYGVNTDEVESGSVKIAGLVCKKFNEFASRTRSNGNIQEYFEQEQVVGICEVDTRAIVRYIRDKGAMNAIISSEEMDVEKLKARLAKVPSMEGLELSSKVSTTKAYTSGDPHAKYRVALLDLGVKTNIIRCLNERNCLVQIFPMQTSAAEMKAWKPDGFMISNGPGDPGVMHAEVKTLKELLQGDIPVFGICLGHQLIAEACGLTTYKMKNGHRGINHPVKNMITGKSEITSQNHGFSVKAEDVKNNKELEMTHINLNDGTVEGLRHKVKDVFSVQYHPESSPGPLDSRYLFDQFVALMEKVKAHKSSGVPA